MLYSPTHHEQTWHLSILETRKLNGIVGDRYITATMTGQRFFIVQWCLKESKLLNYPSACQNWRLLTDLASYLYTMLQYAVYCRTLRSGYNGWGMLPVSREIKRLSPLLVSLTCAFVASYSCGIKHTQHWKMLLPRSWLGDQWSLVTCFLGLGKLPL